MNFDIKNSAWFYNEERKFYIFAKHIDFKGKSCIILARIVLICFNPVQDGLFRGCSRMGDGGGCVAKRPPSLKSVTPILQ